MESVETDALSQVATFFKPESKTWSLDNVQSLEVAQSSSDEIFNLEKTKGAGKDLVTHHETFQTADDVLNDPINNNMSLEGVHLAHVPISPRAPPFYGQGLLFTILFKTLDTYEAVQDAFVRVKRPISHVYMNPDDNSPIALQRCKFEAMSFDLSESLWCIASPAFSC